MNTSRKLEEQLLLARRAEGDRLVLADSVLLSSIDGSRALTLAERDALRASPLTLRRFRRLASARKQAANDAWHGSAGMLRAASGTAPLAAMGTDDGWWTLHFVEQGGDWRVILALAPGAPFAARLLRELPLLRVVDGGGAIVLQGSLDSDGECESGWPFETPPGAHFQEFGARFAVEPVHT